jgi:hypothetical protein
MESEVAYFGLEDDVLLLDLALGNPPDKAVKAERALVYASDSLLASGVEGYLVSHHLEGGACQWLQDQLLLVARRQRTGLVRVDLEAEQVLGGEGVGHLQQ